MSQEIRTLTLVKDKNFNYKLPIHEPSGTDASKLPVIEVDGGIVREKTIDANRIKLARTDLSHALDDIYDVVHNAYSAIPFTEGSDKDNRSKWTKKVVSDLLDLYWPYYNVMVVHPKHTYNWKHSWIHDHVETPYAYFSCGYEIYIMQDGMFLLQGDGGYLNWCFGGSFDRLDASVTFYMP